MCIMDVCLFFMCGEHSPYASRESFVIAFVLTRRDEEIRLKCALVYVNSVNHTAFDEYMAPHTYTHTHTKREREREREEGTRER